MRIDYTKKLVLTKEEQRVIHDLYEIFDRDNDLNTCGVWGILTDIYEDTNERSIDYDYYIEIVD